MEFSVVQEIEGEEYDVFTGTFDECQEECKRLLNKGLNVWVDKSSDISPSMRMEAMGLDY